MEEHKDLESPENQLEEEVELSHTDKLVGVFTEPGATFEQISKFPPKASDWFIPLILFVIVLSLSVVVIMKNETVKYAMQEKQLAAIEKSMQEEVAKGNLTQEQADQRLEQTREMMEGSAGVIFSVVGIVIFTFIFFFVVVGVYYLLVKFVAKGEGNYSSGLVSYGLPMYISILQIVVVVILSFALGKYFKDTSVASFMESDTQTFLGFILSKLDIFTIWFYAVISIAFAKMFKSKSTGVYFGIVFGLWIGFGLLMFFLSQAFPFLKQFTGG